MGELKLGRFGHHPDPADDFCIEVDRLEGVAAEVRAEMRPAHDVNEFLGRLVTFEVGGDPRSVAAKKKVRQLVDEFWGSGLWEKAPARPTPTVPQDVREALEFYAEKTKPPTLGLLPASAADGGDRARKALALLANPVEDRDGDREPDFLCHHDDDKSMPWKDRDSFACDYDLSKGPTKFNTFFHGPDKWGVELPSEDPDSPPEVHWFDSENAAMTALANKGGSDRG